MPNISASVQIEVEIANLRTLLELQCNNAAVNLRFTARAIGGSQTHDQMLDQMNCYLKVAAIQMREITIGQGRLTALIASLWMIEDAKS